MPFDTVAEFASLKVCGNLFVHQEFTHAHCKTLTLACNIASAITNVLISVFLVYYLYILKKGRSEGRTNDLINRMVRVLFVC